MCHLCSNFHHQVTHSKWYRWKKLKKYKKYSKIYLKMITMPAWSIHSCLFLWEALLEYSPSPQTASYIQWRRKPQCVFGEQARDGRTAGGLQEGNRCTAWKVHPRWPRRTAVRRSLAHGLFFGTRHGCTFLCEIIGTNLWFKSLPLFCSFLF